MVRQKYGAQRRRNAGFGGPALVCTLCLALLVGWYGAARTERSAWPPPETRRQSLPTDRLSAQFGFCHSGGGRNCVVDGDTFWFSGQKYRIADIDTPETHGPRCTAEGALGMRATERLHELLNAGAFSLDSADRDTDRYGRALRIVTRAGESIGGILVAEGLAREWDGARHGVPCADDDLAQSIWFAARKSAASSSFFGR